MLGRRNARRRTDIGIQGFSLIELVVVLVILAVLAALATYPLRGAVVRGSLARAVEVVERFDQALRREARSRRQGVSGSIDRSLGKLTVGDPNGLRTFQLPSRVSIDAIRFAGNRPSAATTTVAAGGDGSTDTYALRLAVGDARTWVLLVGGTGQVIHPTDAAQTRALLEVR